MENQQKLSETQTAEIKADVSVNLATQSEPYCKHDMRDTENISSNQNFSTTWNNAANHIQSSVDWRLIQRSHEATGLSRKAQTSTTLKP